MPPTDIEETLHERFKAIEDKVKKRDITPYFQTLNYLHHTKERGFKKISDRVRAAKKLQDMFHKHKNTIVAKMASASSKTGKS